MHELELLLHVLESMGQLFGQSLQRPSKLGERSLLHSAVLRPSRQTCDGGALRASGLAISAKAAQRLGLLGRRWRRSMHDWQGRGYFGRFALRAMPLSILPAHAKTSEKLPCCWPPGDLTTLAQGPWPCSSHVAVYPGKFWAACPGRLKVEMSAVRRRKCSKAPVPLGLVCLAREEGRGNSPLVSRLSCVCPGDVTALLCPRRSPVDEGGTTRFQSSQPALLVLTVCP